MSDPEKSSFLRFDFEMGRDGVLTQREQRGWKGSFERNVLESASRLSFPGTLKG